MAENVPNRPRNRRAEAAKKRAKLEREHAVENARRRVSTFIGLTMLLVFLAIVIYGVFFFDAEQLRRFNEAYAVINKERIEGEIVESKPEPDAKSKGFSQRIDPTYQFVCLADFTRSRYVFQVPEEVYRETQLNAIFPAETTNDWELVSYEQVSLKDVIREKTGIDLGD